MKIKHGDSVDSNATWLGRGLGKRDEDVDQNKGEVMEKVE
jgi:hypothetical protein